MENRVNRFLTPSSNTAFRANGTALYNLSTGAITLNDGELAIIDVDTLQVTGTGGTWGSTKKAMFVVARDLDGDATVETIQTSHVFEVGKNLVSGYEKQVHVDPVAQVKALTWTTTAAETEYCFKVAFSNPMIAEYMGWNELYKTFSVTTACAPTGTDCVALADEIVDLVNADPDGFITASKINGDFTITGFSQTTIDANDSFRITYNGVTTSVTLTDVTVDDAATAALIEAELQAALDDNGFGGTVTVTWNALTNTDITITGAAADSMLLYDDSGAATLQAFTAGDVDGCPVIELTANFAALADFCNIPVNIFKTEGVSMTITPMCGFECNSAVVEPQSLVYEENGGIVVKALEEESTGLYLDHLYRFTGLGASPHPSRTLYVDDTADYTTYVIAHTDLHEGAPSGHYFRSNLKTILAIDETLTNVITGLDAALPALS